MVGDTDALLACHYNSQGTKKQNKLCNELMERHFE
jgi:hypothetical protein